MKHWAGAGKFFTTFAVMVALSVATGFGGMAELGRDADAANGNKKVKITVNPPFQVTTNAGESAGSVLQRLAVKINAKGRYKATVAGRVITVKRSNGDDVDIELVSEDRGFKRGKTLGNGEGTHRIAWVLEPGGTTAGGSTVTVTVDDSFVAAINPSAGLSGSAVLASLKTQLDAVLPGTYTVSIAGNKIKIKGANNVDWEDDDTGITSFGVESTGKPSDIPTLSGWGMAFMVLLLAAAAWILMRRRARLAGA